MWALASITNSPFFFADRSGVSNSSVPVSGAPEVLYRPNTVSWSRR